MKRRTCPVPRDMGVSGKDIAKDCPPSIKDCLLLAKDSTTSTTVMGLAGKQSQVAPSSKPFTMNAVIHRLTPKLKRKKLSPSDYNPFACHSAPVSRAPTPVSESAAPSYIASR
jgi:hypothetical protein